MDLQIIEQKIYEIRGQKVMLDFDLAVLYQIETKYLKRSVRTNLRRFPLDFMFELTRGEFESLRCNFSTSKRGGNRYLPFAFTEHGVTMLAAVLNSEKAIHMNIAIVRAFIALRKMAIQYEDIMAQIDFLKGKLGNHDVQLNQIYDAIENLLDDKVEKGRERTPIGFKIKGRK